jgi:hypothetical protein
MALSPASDLSVALNRITLDKPTYHAGFTRFRGSLLRTTSSQKLREIGTMAIVISLSALPLMCSWLSIMPGLALALSSGFMYLALRNVLHLDRPTGSFCALVFALHPQTLGIFSNGSLPTMAGSSLLPIVFYLAHLAINNSSKSILAIAAFILGISSCFLGVAALLCAFAIVAQSRSPILQESRLGQADHRTAIWLGLVAIGYVAACAANFVHPLSATEITATPLNLINRGVLNFLHPTLPAEYFGTEPVPYVGWSILGCCLTLAFINCGRTSMSAKNSRMYFLFFTLLAWLALGPFSLHRFVTGILATATVERYVDPGNLHILGVVVVTIALMALVTFIHWYQLMKGHRHAGILVVLIGALLVLLGWSYAPTDVFDAKTIINWAGAPGVVSSTSLFCLICCLGAGLKTVREMITSSQTAGLYVGMSVLFLIEFLPPRPIPT